MLAVSRRAGQRLYGYRSEACRPRLVGFWLVLQAVPAVGSVAEPRASRGPELPLVLGLPAVVHRAKSRGSTLAEWAGVHLHGKSRKAQRLHDRSAPVWLPKPVRRQNADEDKKSRSQTR